MDPNKFLFPIVALDGNGRPAFLRGNAFPVTADGGLMTCRHVISVEEGVSLVALDRERGIAVPIASAVVPTDPSSLDLAFLPKALGRVTHRLPFLPPPELIVGHDVASYGFYSPSGRIESAGDGYFKGNIVNFRTTHAAIATLSFPVIEGMSGSPVVTYHNGVKLVGICFGSESQRILADEIIDVTDGDHRYTETVNRIVEFGLAYRSEVIEAFLLAEAPDAQPVVTDGVFDVDELG